MSKGYKRGDKVVLTRSIDHRGRMIKEQITTKIVAILNGTALLETGETIKL